MQLNSVLPIVTLFSTLLVLLFFVGVPILLGILTGKIAEKKGYGFIGFFFLGLFLPMIGLLIALCLDNKNQQIERLQTAWSNAPSVQPAPPVTSSEIERYYTLLQQGAITQEEFDAKKKELLGQ